MFQQTVPRPRGAGSPGSPFTTPSRVGYACPVRIQCGVGASIDFDSAMRGKAEKAKHQIARRHHFVSEGYLAGFTNTGTSKGVLYAYDHSPETFFKAKPKDVAFEIDYNRIDNPNYAPDALETGLGQFESHAIRELRKIITTGKLTSPEEFSWVYNLIALFAVKTPALRSGSDAAQKRMARVIIDLAVSSKEIFESQISAARASGFLRPELDVSYENAKEFVTRRVHDLNTSRTSHHHRAFRVR